VAVDGDLHSSLGKIWGIIWKLLTCMDASDFDLKAPPLIQQLHIIHLVPIESPSFNKRRKKKWFGECLAGISP